MENSKKTDLARVISVSGQSGLYLYIAQARNGVVVESLANGGRTVVGMKNKVSTLEDISIYTAEGEMKLKDVFVKLHEVLGDADAPGAKAPADALKELFAKAVPDYDADRFYVSHMKKVVTWYNDLKNHASLDFMTDEDRKKEAEAAETAEAEPENE
jgi:hypothetical protein